MKKSISPISKEDAEFVCDSCGEVAYGQMTIHFWYGSKYDMTQSTNHFCDVCLDKIKISLAGNFNVNIKSEEITEL